MTNSSSIKVKTRYIERYICFSADSCGYDVDNWPFEETDEFEFGRVIVVGCIPDDVRLFIDPC